jgi:hypothetical protein
MKKNRWRKCPPPPALEKHNPQLNHLAGSKYDDWNTPAVAGRAMLLDNL